jgi:hypothetical protein
LNFSTNTFDLKEFLKKDSLSTCLNISNFQKRASLSGIYKNIKEVKICACKISVHGNLTKPRASNMLLL